MHAVKWWHRPIACLAKGFLWLYLKTLRTTFKGIEQAETLLKNNSAIFLLWHDSLVVLPLFGKRLCLSRALHILISGSRDGDVASRLAELFNNIFALRIHQRSKSATLKRMCSLLNSGESLLITPDVPRGPRRKMKRGSIFASYKTDTPLVPIVYACSRCIYLKSWDHFRIPLPFSKVSIECLPPIYPRKDIDLSQTAGSMMIEKEHLLTEQF